jgi:hypothetical protein
MTRNFSLLAAAVTAIVLSQTAFAQQPQPTVYSVSEAGVQLTLPAGWEAEKDKKGNLTVSKKEADGYVVIALTVLPIDASMTLDKEFAAFSAGIFDNIKKDWKAYKAEDVGKDTQDGMQVISQSFTGTNPDLGGELEGLVILIGAPKPLGIFAQRTRKHSDALDKESSDLLSSIKKVK